MTRVLNYNVSVPAVVTDQVAIVVPQTPSKVILAELGIFVLPEAANHNRVELKATVGFKGVTGTGSVLFRVFRDAQEIYYAREGFEAFFEQFYVTTLQIIDINVAPGAHGYSLYIEKLSAGTAATVIGPINLSATVYEV